MNIPTAVPSTESSGTISSAAASGSRLLRSIDPATGETVGTVPVTPVDAIPDLVGRAQAAQVGWGSLSLDERRARLAPAAERLRSAAERIAGLITREMGKPIVDARNEIRYLVDGFGGMLDECAGALAPEVREDERVRSTLVFDPLGACAVITPWNFPVAMVQECVLPALMAGNAVLLKPSEESPLCAQEWVACVAEGLPPDVLQIVFGDEAQGKALVAADVDLIAFTGSRAAGKHILGVAGGGLKRVILELGGKDPLIVLRDADIDAAAAFAARNSFRNAGQVCVSTERIFVHAEIADAFARKVAEKALSLKQGSGLDESVTLGPMVNRRQKDHVMRQVASAVAQGARVVTGNDERPGNFVAPTVLVDVRPDMDIMRDETFGPVACIVRFDDPEQAIRWSNESPYALGGAVFGRDVGAAEAVARRLHSAMVGINQGCGGAKGTPWVGAKESGYGYHSGREGHRQFAQVRVITRAR